MQKQIDDGRLPTLDQIVAYLNSSGWEEQKSPKERIRVFSHDSDDDKVSVMLPSSAKYSDASSIIKEFLISIASLTDMTTDEVIAEICAPVTDILRLRLLPQRAKEREDFISMEEAWIIVSGIRDALAFSAQSEAAPLENKPEKIPKMSGAGKSFVRKCRFAHTFKGSFGLTIESPLEIKQLVLPFVAVEDTNIEVPFERRVMERFAKGLRTVQAATENSDASLISSAYRTGFNANICEALFKVFEQTILKEIECKFLWSTSWQPYSDEFVTSTSISRKSAALLKIAADQLKKVPPSQYVTLVGALVKLDQATPSSAIEGIALNKKGLGYRAVLLTKFENRFLKVAMFLNDDQHPIACDAYRDRKIVSVKGTLEQKPRSSMLYLPDEFEIVRRENLPDYAGDLLG